MSGYNEDEFDDTCDDLTRRVYGRYGECVLVGHDAPVSENLEVTVTYAGIRWCVFKETFDAVESAADQLEKK